VAVEPLSSCDNRSAFNTAKKLEHPLLADFCCLVSASNLSKPIIERAPEPSKT
jgi:hypothetical protein